MDWMTHPTAQKSVTRSVTAFSATFWGQDLADSVKHETPAPEGVNRLGYQVDEQVRHRERALTPLMAQEAHTADVDVAHRVVVRPRQHQDEAEVRRLPSWGCAGTGGCPAAAAT